MTKNQLSIVFVLLGLVAGLITFLHRYDAEQLNRRVELVVDWTDVQALANTTSRPVDDVLQQLKASGITTVAVNEDTLDTLRANGIVSYTRDGDVTVATFAPGFPGQCDRVAQMMSYKTRVPVVREGTNVLRVNAPWPQFSGTPIGLDGDAVKTIRRNNLLVAPRLLNYTGVTPRGIHWQLQQTIRQCGRDGTGPLIFSGAAVLGNRPLIPYVASQLIADRLTYGSVEFAKTVGDDDLSRDAAERTVRVHSIGTDEMQTMDEPTAIERFVRGARERNIRVCYIRLFTNGTATDPDVIHANTDYVDQIVTGLKEARLTIGQAHPFEADGGPAWHGDPKPGRLFRILMSLAVMGGGLLLIRTFLGIDGKAYKILFTLAILAGIGLALPNHTAKGREILALLAAVTFPTLGLCYYALPSPNKSGAMRETLGRAFAVYARMTLSTLAGVVLVVGLLSGRLFLIKVDEFLGVKLVLVTPVLLVAIYYGLGLADLPASAGWNERVARIKQSITDVAGEPIKIGQLVLGLIALAALIVFVARSGNDPGVDVSPIELKIRALLDKYLLVRPRTKEFLLGYPALFVALAAVISGRFPRWVLPLIVIGSIGQASLMDTFCHLHTPLFISLLRGLIGWILGAFFGAVIYVLAAREADRRLANRAAA